MATRGQRIRQRLLGRYRLVRERRRVVAQRGWQAFPAVPAPSGFDDFMPTQIAGCVLWLDADYDVYTDAGITFATDGQTVQQWNDRSGNGNHASQSTGDAKPLFQVAVVNGRPVVRFDGSDDSLVIPHNAAMNSDTVTILTVSAAAAAEANEAPLIEKRTTGGGTYPYSAGYTGGATGRASLSAFLNPNQPIANATADLRGAGFRVLTFMRSVPLDNLRVWVNGVLDATTTDTTTGAATNLENITVGSAIATFLNGDISLLLMYNSDLTAGQLNILHNWMGRRYGIAVI